MIRFGTYHQQQGQALPLAVLLLGVGLVAVYMAFNVGQVASTKTRVMHASDNAAYSAATYQARVLNYMAYTNRAMITNHVTAAQAVTAAGYLEYQQTGVSNLCDILCNIPWTAPVMRIINQSVVVTQRFVNIAANAVMTAVNVQNRILAASQQGIWIAAMARMPDIVADVARANHPQAQVVTPLLATTLADYDRMTALYRSRAQRWRFGRTVQNARDNWTANRSRDGLQARWPRNFRFSRRGGTELSDLQRWEATDTLSVKFEVWDASDWEWDDGERPPIGWGSVTSGRGATDRNRNSYGRSLRDNRNATRSAWRNQDRMRVGYEGIGNFVDLTDARRGRTLQVNVEVFVNGNAAQTANQPGNRLVAGPSLRTTDQFVGNRIAASAKAETRFERPTPRADGNTELASTFNPYWYARLVSPTNGNLLTADTASGRLTTTLTPYY